MADEDLAARARAVAADWSLSVDAPFPLSTWSYVAPVGDDAVLKIAAADDDESLHESEALRFWDGEGAVRLLRCDRSGRALLLERARPGSDIAEVGEDTATSIVIDIARRLWRPAGAPFRSVADAVPGWLDRAAPESAAGRALLARARRRFAQLSVGGSVLIHGDLHHHNILDAGGRHVAIDPKPMLGEPEFDVAPFLWNPLGSVMTLERTERRLSMFAAAGLDWQRMCDWALIRGAYLRIGDWVEGDPIGVLGALGADTKPAVSRRAAEQRVAGLPLFDRPGTSGSALDDLRSDR